MELSGTVRGDKQKDVFTRDLRQKRPNQPSVNGQKKKKKRKTRADQNYKAHKHTNAPLFKENKKKRSRNHHCLFSHTQLKSPNGHCDPSWRVVLLTRNLPTREYLIGKSRKAGTKANVNSAPPPIGVANIVVWVHHMNVAHPHHHRWIVPRMDILPPRDKRPTPKRH